MIKKAFWGLSTPSINYEMLPVHLPEAEKIPTPQRITLFHPKNDALNVPAALGIGDPVKTGEKLSVYPDQNDYVISPVTGKIASLSPYTGDFGKSYIAITITPDGNEIIDDTFQQQIQSPTRVSDRRTGRSAVEPAGRFQRRH
jgi:electron transport complex protein RnfC